MKTDTRNMTLRDLWNQFLPLSVSDVTMAAGDPLITTTLARLPNPTLNLAAMGIAKAIAIFFESPIIMLLHASNALATTANSRRALWRFMLLACAFLTVTLAVLVIPPVFDVLAIQVIGLEPNLISPARDALLFLLLWPAAIGWRRYYQGLLIRHGQARAVARAGIARLGMVGSTLTFTTILGLSGVQVAGTALIVGVICEALIVTIAARRSGATRPPALESAEGMPHNLQSVWKFYWPLASSMLVVWGGRVVLITIVARSFDSTIALAAWPAAWGLTLVVANATRMVQQVVIKNRGLVADRLLLSFALSVGGVFAMLLLAVGATPPGAFIIEAFVGHNDALVTGVRPVVLLCAVCPLLIALQNAAQGFIIGDGKPGRINIATWIGTATLLGVAVIATHAGLPGATAAALAMMSALICETVFLAVLARPRWTTSESSQRCHAVIPKQA